MSLSSALATAMSGLRANQAALSIVSSNVANAQTPGYVAQSANQVETSTGEARRQRPVAGVNRELEPFVQTQLRTETSGGGLCRPDGERPDASCNRLRHARRGRARWRPRSQQFYHGGPGAVDEFGQPCGADRGGDRCAIAGAAAQCDDARHSDPAFQRRAGYRRLGRRRPMRRWPRSPQLNTQLQGLNADRSRPRRR